MLIATLQYQLICVVNQSLILTISSHAYRVALMVPEDFENGGLNKVFSLFKLFAHLKTQMKNVYLYRIRTYKMSTKLL